MEMLYGLIGWAIGLFLWSSILGGLFATLPLVIRLKKSGDIKQIKWVPIIGSVMIAVVVLVAIAVWARQLFTGALVASVFILFSLGKLKREAIENIRRDYPELNSSVKKK
ncbi:MAG: hypothetical protein Q7R60_01290 [bacterium]|nr:hypothetical protein [bacterium]